MDDRRSEPEYGLIETERQPITSAIYDRVYAYQRDPRSHLEELRGYAQRNGWPVCEYHEAASRELGDPCPVLTQRLEDAKAGKFLVVLCWMMARFGRSVPEFIHNVVVLNNAGVRFICPSQAFDTDPRSHSGKMLMHVLSVFAECERDLLAERIQLGVARALNEQRTAAKGSKSRLSRSGKKLSHGARRKILAPR